MLVLLLTALLGLSAGTIAILIRNRKRVIARGYVSFSKNWVKIYYHPKTKIISINLDACGPPKQSKYKGSRCHHLILNCKIMKQYGITPSQITKVISEVRKLK